MPQVYKNISRFASPDLFLDSPALSPGWQYNLNDVTDIKTTDDFLNLDDKDKGCSIESKEECSTRTYVKRLTENCDCLPLSMKTEGQKKVKNQLE